MFNLFLTIGSKTLGIILVNKTMLSLTRRNAIIKTQLSMVTPTITLSTSIFAAWGKDASSVFNDFKNSRLCSLLANEHSIFI